MGKLACADMRTSDGRIAQKTIAGVPKVRSNQLSCAADAESGGCADRVLARRAAQTFDNPDEMSEEAVRPEHEFRRRLREYRRYGAIGFHVRQIQNQASVQTACRHAGLHRDLEGKE